MAFIILVNMIDSGIENSILFETPIISPDTSKKNRKRRKIVLSERYLESFVNRVTLAVDYRLLLVRPTTITVHDSNIKSIWIGLIDTVIVISIKIENMVFTYEFDRVRFEDSTGTRYRTQTILDMLRDSLVESIKRNVEIDDNVGFDGILKHELILWR